ncbi:dihydropteroate synthase [bacterium]|nr:dihydropteroate synthase [bacterium]
MASSDILFDNSKPRVIGILNMTPDSFYDGGQYFAFQDAIARVATMVKVGADAVDIGGESTRPGSDPVSLDEELNRVIPVVKAISGRFDICISIDTRKVRVAIEAVKAGAHIVNNVDGLRDEKMAKYIADTGLPVIIMHMHGEPETMQVNPLHGDPVHEIKAFFDDKIALCEKLGIKKFILDPGIGFGKTFEQNLSIIRNIPSLKCDGIPLLIGHSNKEFIGRITGRKMDSRVYGTNAITTLAIYNGADIVRVHEIVSARDAASIAVAVREERIGTNG